MYLHSLRLEKVKNFVELLDFRFDRPDRSYEGWNVFIGGNASGKTTLLKAIALALCGDEFGRVLLRNDFSGWVSEGAKKARVIAEVQYDRDFDFFSSKGNVPRNPFKCGVRWEQPSKGNPTFARFEERTGKQTRVTHPKRGPWNENAAGWFSAGYGPMRRLTGSSAEAMHDAVGSGLVPRFISLFREDVALSESEIWLKNLQFKALEETGEARRRANTLVKSIEGFLNDGLLPHGFQIDEIRSDHVYMKTTQGTILPMRDLSEGYRCVYGLMLDIIRNMANVYGETQLFTRNSDNRMVADKPGILLIDEIETHLHPKWQQTICTWLKQRFPKIQFLVTTHSPLIVQAADPGGIYFLPAPGEHRKAHRFDQHEYERIVLGRAEKILLGEAFGLDYTRGDWALRQIDRYRHLAAKKRANALTSPAEKKEFNRLAQQMEMEFSEKTEMIA